MTGYNYNNAKGYRGELAIELLLRNEGHDASRPRAGRRGDIGDIAGVPLVVSVKNHAQLKLSTWIIDLHRMVNTSDLETGVVWHKKVGKGDPCDWYVTTSGRLFLPLYHAYANRER